MVTHFEREHLLDGNGVLIAVVNEFNVNLIVGDDVRGDASIPAPFELSAVHPVGLYLYRTILTR